MDVDSMTGLGTGAVTGVGGTIVALKWFISSAVEPIRSEMREDFRRIVAEAEEEFDERFDALAEKVALSISTISKLEKSDGVAQIELLRALKEMAEKSNEFRDALRMEFLSKDAADGKIIKIINEHCRNCPRKVSK
jgi:hypothetical protein